TPAPTPKPTPAPTPTPSPTPTPTPAPTPAGYTFDDEFNGSSLSSVWIHHFSFGGIENTWSSTQAGVANGMLTITADRSGSAWVSQLLDTKTTWNQKYGYFEARMKIPKGPGLW